MSLSTLWQTLVSRFQQDAHKLIYAPIPKARTEATYDDAPLKAGESYFRLFLVEMFLTKERDWFTDWHPAVHCSVKLTFNNQPAVSFSSVAKAPGEKQVNGVLLNYKLSELMPFNGGDVEIAAGLLALKGKNDLSLAINLLASFSSLVAPPLGQAIAIADKVATGVEDLIDTTKGDIHLPLHQTFVSSGGGGDSDLRPGYFAVIRASQDTIDPNRLTVKADRLHYSHRPGDPPKALEGVDHMLLRIEGRKSRDDWQFASIVKPLSEAEAARLRGEETRAVTLINEAILAAYTSPDLAEADKIPIIDAIKQRFDRAKKIGYGAVGEEELGLNDFIKNHAPSRESVRHLQGTPVEDLFLA